jgi:hypothetical protein
MFRIVTPPLSHADVSPLIVEVVAAPCRFGKVSIVNYATGDHEADLSRYVYLCQGAWKKWRKTLPTARTSQMQRTVSLSTFLEGNNDPPPPRVVVTLHTDLSSLGLPKPTVVLRDEVVPNQVQHSAYVNVPMRPEKEEQQHGGGKVAKSRPAAKSVRIAASPYSRHSVTPPLLSPARITRSTPSKSRTGYLPPDGDLPAADDCRRTSVPVESPALPLLTTAEASTSRRHLQSRLRTVTLSPMLPLTSEDEEAVETFKFDSDESMNLTSNTSTISGRRSVASPSFSLRRTRSSVSRSSTNPIARSVKGSSTAKNNDWFPSAFLYETGKNPKEKVKGSTGRRVAGSNYLQHALRWPDEDLDAVKVCSPLLSRT